MEILRSVVTIDLYTMTNFITVGGGCIVLPFIIKRRLYKIMETVKYKGKTYTVSRYVDTPDKKLFTVAKQNKARELLLSGLGCEEVSQRLNVDTMALISWWEAEIKRINISIAVKNYSEGKSKKVICTNLTTGEEKIYPSLSSCGKAIGTVASTVRLKIQQGKSFRNYAFRYAED